MNLMSTLIYLMPMTGMLILILQQSHFLMVLLSLESITLSMVMFSSLSMLLMNSNFPVMSVVILTFGACEASFGLSLMVIMSRAQGSDLLKSVSMNKC